MTSWASSREAALKPETGRISGSALSAVTLVVLPIGGTAVSGAFDDGRCEQKRRTTIMTGVAALSTITAGSGLARYFEEIRRLPMLEPDEEFMLARRWRERSDRDAEHRLVTSHLRLVAKIAAGYRGYGLPAAEIVSEGNLGLMKAVKRFDPEKGFRLATYAMWWIRASIQEYVLRSWSLVKMGTTANQKRLFFNLRRAKSEISALEEGDLRPDQVMTIAKRVGVSANDVVQMNRRLSGDASLNAPIRDDGNSSEWLDWLVDDAPTQERLLIETEELDDRRSALREALIVLDGRERRIFEARHLADEPITLADLAEEFGVSRERVRQIEVRTFEKVQNSVRRRVAAMEGSQARIAHQPRPFLRDRRQQTRELTTHLHASLSDVSSVTAAA
jgi:RNA polymerase sigma-32 factor